MKKERVLEDKLQKLEKLEESSRKSSRKHLDKLKAKGQVQISAIISAKAFNEICRQRDASVRDGKQITIGQIIERSLFPSPGGKGEPIYYDLFDSPMYKE